MSVNAGNMITLQFCRRLQQFIRLRYAKQGEIQLSRADTKKLTQSCYRVKREQTVSETGGTVSRLTNKWDDTDAIVELEIGSGRCRENLRSGVHCLRRLEQSRRALGTPFGSCEGIHRGAGEAGERAANGRIPDK
jgi:hypothetical protein